MANPPFLKVPNIIHVFCIKIRWENFEGKNKNFVDK